VRPELAERGLDRYYQSALQGQSSLLAHRFHGYLLRIPVAAGDMPQSCRVAPLVDGNAIIGTVTTIEDVSERVYTEQELRRQIGAAEQARAEAEAALRAKDEFLATLSHELRTPLNAVLGWTNILLNGNTDSATRERALRVIERNAGSQARLIDDMLDMARIVTGKIRLELSVVDAVAATSAAIDVVRPTASTKRISMHTDFGSRAETDPRRCRATPAGGLERAFQRRQVHAVRRPHRGAGGRGAGDRPDRHHRYGQRHHRGVPALRVRSIPSGQSSMTRSEGGLGLGLALVRQLVDLHGGQVAVTSEGRRSGHHVHHHLPCARPRGDSAPCRADTAAGAGRAGQRADPHRGRRSRLE
jgi:signal transduction histidine kinase